MAIIDNVKFNGTDYSIGASDSGLPTVYYPTDFGLDLENDRWGDNISIPIAKYPCATFTDSTIIILSPDYAIPYSRQFRIGYNGWLYNDSNSSTGTILVGDVYYRYIKYNITWNTEYTPQTIPSTAYWRMYIPYLKSQHSEVRNVDVKILADFPLEDITPKLITELYNLPQGTDLLNGKTWLALGDSYTNYLNGMWSSLATKWGMTYANYGVASSTIRVSSGGSDYAYQPMSQRVDTMISEHANDDVGLITFMGGINDGYTPEKIGTLDSTALTTIYGGCHHIFNSLINAFPNAMVLVILQPVSGNGTATEDGFDGEQNSIYAAQLKQRAVKETAEFYGLPICDCCFKWYTTANPNDLATIWQSDKLHLTAIGNNDLTNKMVYVINDELTIK